MDDCLDCGTCCFSSLETYIRVSGDDYERLGDAAETLTTFLGNQAFMRLREGHCIALQIEPNKGQFVCSIYGRRPTICRDLERGSAACEGELISKGDRPKRALTLAR